MPGECLVLYLCCIRAVSVLYVCPHLRRNGTANPPLLVPLRPLKLPFKTGAEALKRELNAL